MREGQENMCGWGVFDIMHGRSGKTIDGRIQCEDGARQVFTDQADVARTEHEAP